MLKESEVEELASEYNLDVRPLDHAYRLIDSKGIYLIDIYFKRNKRGEIVKNSAYSHKKKSWGVIKTLEELKTYI